MPRIESTLASLPRQSYRPNETVLAEGATTGRLMILETGAVEVSKGGVRIAEVATPGAVLGEFAALLDRPDGADVRTLGTSSLHVANTNAFLDSGPAAALHVASLLARRFDGANRALVDAKQQLGETEAPKGALASLVERIGATLQHDRSPREPVRPMAPS